MNQSNLVLLEVNGLKKYYSLRKRGFWRAIAGYVKAVDDVSFTIRRGETVGVIGESGCGKSTLGRCVTRLSKLNAGSIILHANERDLCVNQLERGDNTAFRKAVQMIFQDPFASLNPRMNVLEIVGEPLLVNKLAKGRALEDQVVDIIGKVGLREEHLRRFPHSFSGGQRQRINIARALVIHPQLVIADEPVSALDVSIQAQILNLLLDLQQEYGLAYLFISHSMSVIRYMSERILVMYAGKLVETGPREQLLKQPAHPYTEMLLQAVPKITRCHAAAPLALNHGEPPDFLKLPIGCVFSPRCAYAQAMCHIEPPYLKPLGADHLARCHYASALNLKGIF